MEETEPMADLMRCRSALVVISRRPTRHRLRKHIASILVVLRASRRHIGGEVADAEEAAAKVGKEVDVQVFVGAFA